MTEDDRFTWKTVHGWHKNAFLVVMNGLDKKNKRLKQEKEELMQDWIRVFLSVRNENKRLKEEKDYWKSACAKSDNENVILKKELLDVVEQGYELSNSYNEYLEERKKDMLKHYSDKRRVQKRI